jgi:hypothetical protein
LIGEIVLTPTAGFFLNAIMGKTGLLSWRDFNSALLFWGDRISEIVFTRRGCASTPSGNRPKQP